MDPQQREQDNQKGNKGAVDYVNSAVNHALNARRAFKLFKSLRAAGTAEAAAAEGTAVAAAGWPVIIALGVVLLAVIVILLLSGFTSGGTTPPSIPGDTQPIPGLTVRKEGPSSVGNGEKIRYTIGVTYTGNSEIVIKDPIPSKTDLVDNETTGTHRVEDNTVVWPLKDNPTIGNTYSFTLTVQPKENDIIVSNKAFGESVGGGGGGSCIVGSNSCSVENLSRSFPSDQARNASIICQKESGSNPGAANKGCLTGESADYSIGLFQINLLAHCPGAFSSFTINPPSCTISNIILLQACENKYRDPEENIRAAVSLSQNGNNWNPWSAARVCGIIK